MSDLDHDHDLADRVTRTLRAVAAATPVDDATPVGDPVAVTRRRTRSRRVLAAAAAATVLGAGALAAVSGRGADQHVEVEPAAPSARTGSALPAGFDVASATPVFSVQGDADDVAAAYLGSRFPDFPHPGVTTGNVELDGERAEIAWSTGDDGGEIASGRLHLRRVGDRWAVVAATTDGVDMSDVVHDGERVRGAIRTSLGDSLFVDVLDVRGEPVRHAPRPAGYGEAYQFGTAGGPAYGTLDLDVRTRGTPAVVRVSLVGGTILSVTELRLDPPPLPAHRDLDACVERNSTGDKEPAPDVVHRACADALEGDVLAAGAAGARTWELVRSDEPAGRWTTLRSVDQIGSFRAQRGEDLSGRDPADAPVSSIDACCAIGDHVAGHHIAVVAVLHPGIQALRVRPDAGASIEVAVVHDPHDAGAAYAVALVPAGSGHEARADVQLRDGRWLTLDTVLDLDIVGG